MYTPKEDIYNALLETGVHVIQGSESAFSKVPAITFNVSDNATELDLGNDISSQTIVVTVDIWTDTSMEASALLRASEEIMRGIGYRLSYSADVPKPESALHHINCRFETVR